MSNESGPLGPGNNDQHDSGPGGAPRSGPPPATHDLDRSVPDGRLDAAASTWREQYLRERKRARFLMGTTIGATVLLAGSLVYTATQTDPTPDPAAAVGSGPVGSGLGGGPGDGIGGGAEPGIGGGNIADRFFNPDGSLDQAAIEDFRARIEQFGGQSMMGDRILDAVESMVASGEITRAQADELLASLGLSTGGES